MADINRFYLRLSIALALIGTMAAAEVSESKPQMERGRELYARNCLICHQLLVKG